MFTTISKLYRRAMSLPVLVALLSAGWSSNAQATGAPLLCKALFKKMSFADQIAHQLSDKVSPKDQATLKSLFERENKMLEDIDKNFAKVIKMVRVEMRPLRFFNKMDFFEKYGIGSNPDLVRIHGIHDITAPMAFETREQIIDYLQLQKRLVIEATQNATSWARGLILTNHLRTLKEVAEYPNYDPMAHKLANDVYRVAKLLNSPDVLMIKKILQMGVKAYDITVYMSSHMKTAVIEFQVELLTSNQKAALSFELQLYESEKTPLSRDELFSESFLSGGYLTDVLIFRPTEHTKLPTGFELFYDGLYNGTLGPFPLRSQDAQGMLKDPHIGMGTVFKKEVRE